MDIPLLKPPILILLLVFLILLSDFNGLENDGGGSGVLANPGRKGGGGGSGGSGRSRGGSGGSGKSSWGSLFGGSKKKSGSSSSAGYGGQSKKKSSTKSKLKKAAIVGAGVYVGYKLGKLSSKFSGYRGGGGYGFNDWNSWREVDGFLCRNNQDCNWIDRELYCQDYELDFTPSALWFGGDVARIVGECSCPPGMFFDDDEMSCSDNSFLGSVGAIVGVILAILIACICCCAGAAFCACRHR